MKAIMSVCIVGLVALSLGVLPAAAQDVPRTIKGGILNGKAVSLPKPEYPADAKAAGLEGAIFVDVLIDESGAVISAVASSNAEKTNKFETPAEETGVTPADLVLRQAAEKAALEAKFSPTLLSGVPVKVSGKIIYNFVLGDNYAIIDGGIINGKASDLPMPSYPDAAKAVRACGPVSVRVTVDENGDVVAATAISGHPLLRHAAVEAARAAKLSPTSLNGQPVKVSGVLTYNFVVPGGGGECSRS